MNTPADMQTWLDEGRHLPECLRDFHDQKDIFKAIHETTKVEDHPYAGEVNWRTGQCYVIDIFLWWMAKRGYTLQRSRMRMEYRDLDKDLQEAGQSLDSRLSEIFSRQIESRNAASEAGALLGRKEAP